jgi:CRP-like cAMP-binding protein
MAYESASLSPDVSLTGNLLLDVLPSTERAALDTQLERVDLPVGRVLYEPDERIKHVYFPATGVVSMVSTMDGETVEVGTVGNEGMAGLPLLLHTDKMPTKGFIQVPGHGVRLTAEQFRAAVRELPHFERVLFRYAQALFDQVAQSAACNRLHSLEERCARWLLMTADRVQDEALPLKQQFLAEMLGVHRPAVTVAASALQRAGFIRYTRGKVTILDRAGLEGASCDCYRIVRRSFARVRDGAAREAIADEVDGKQG